MTMSKQAITNWKKLSDQLRKFNEYVHYENLKIGIDDNYEVSFRDTNSYLWKEEEYKSEIAVNARKMLSSHKWDESWIGTGKIAKCVIDAMDHSGNLVQYNQKINFENRFNPEHETFQPDAERVIFELFRGSDDESAFNAAIKTFGAKYDTIAYAKQADERGLYRFAANLRNIAKMFDRCGYEAIEDMKRLHDSQL